MCTKIIDRCEYEETKSKVGPYDIIRKIGSGSSGDVMYATHCLTHENKAIKIIKKNTVSDSAKLDTEIKAMLMLKHEHVAQLETVMESNDTVFLVIELCGGGTLMQYMNGTVCSIMKSHNSHSQRMLQDTFLNKSWMQ